MGSENGNCHAMYTHGHKNLTFYRKYAILGFPTYLPFLTLFLRDSHNKNLAVQIFTFADGTILKLRISMEKGGDWKWAKKSESSMGRLHARYGLHRGKTLLQWKFHFFILACVCCYVLVGPKLYNL